jgi:hypothetical protein
VGHPLLGGKNDRKPVGPAAFVEEALEAVFCVGLERFLVGRSPCARQGGEAGRSGSLGECVDDLVDDPFAGERSAPSM